MFPPARTSHTGRLAVAALAWLLAAGCSQNDETRHAGPGPQRGGQRATPLPLASPTRAVWVARYHYRTPEDIREIMRNCAALGLNTVLFQVRGDGTVLYPSRYEPWGREYDYRDPGFDPLAAAVSEAHAAGLRIEAWVNLMPGWYGEQPPPRISQLYHTHPEWFLHDAEGRRQPLSKFYAILNPCLPEVRKYLTGLLEELVTRYDVDGVHLDYVRYAWDETPNAKARYPRDPETLALYRRETGKAPDDDATAWANWRANQLTKLVIDIRRMLQRKRPGAALTAAVFQDPQEAFNSYLQNAAGWLRASVIDAALPMAYSEKPDVFERRIEAYRAAAPGRRVIPGVGLYKLDSADEVRDQLAQCDAWGGEFALFSYESLYPNAGDPPRGAPRAEQAARQMRRAVVAERLQQ